MKFPATSRFIASLALIAGMALPAYAFASETSHELHDQFLGHTQQDVMTALEERGYAIDETENEDGKFEVEISRDGKSFEVEVDLATGKVTEVENDDDD